VRHTIGPIGLSHAQTVPTHSTHTSTYAQLTSLPRPVPTALHRDRHLATCCHCDNVFGIPDVINMHKQCSVTNNTAKEHMEGFMCIPLECRNANANTWLTSYEIQSCIYRTGTVLCNITGKGKAISLQAWTGPEGSRRLGLPDAQTHEGGKVVSPTHRPPLPPGNIPGTHFF
jgi:hypothetical protein